MTFFFSLSLCAQCNILNNNEINSFCKSLKTLMDCNLIKKDYENALYIYRTYLDINKDYQPPIEVKRYFSETFEKNKISLSKFKVTPASTEPKRNNGFRSSMPEIIEINQ